MKKIFSLLLVLTVLFFCTGCSKTTDQSQDSSASQSVLISFKSADINMADDFSEIICNDRRAAFYFIFGKLKSGEYSGYLTDTEFTEKSAFTFTPQDEETVRTATLMRF